MMGATNVTMANMEQAASRAHGAGQGAIRIEDVVKIYDPEGAAVMAVDHCSLDIAAGEICMIVGPSGCGKTTLLNAIAGFHSITSGRIYLDGELLCGPDKPQATPGADRIVVFQNGALFPWKTNLENVAFGPIMQGKMKPKEAYEKARDVMADAGLSGAEHSFPGEISSGVRRRVEIVRALMNEPKVLLFDEPYRALDSLTKSVMHEALLEIYYKNKVTIFFITHDLEEAIFLGHKLAIMTTRPCRPKKILEIDIPHPRDYSVLTSPRFRELMEETADAVHEEARKAFELGEKEG
jgi:NitT/TauT family transport system ATP-binding protein